MNAPIHTGYYAPIDRYDGLGNPLTPPDTYPGGWLVVAVLAAIVALWLPVMILGVIGAVVLGVLAIWQAVNRG